MLGAEVAAVCMNSAVLTYCYATQVFAGPTARPGGIDFGSQLGSQLGTDCASENAAIRDVGCMNAWPRLASPLSFLQGNLSPLGYREAAT